MAGITYDEKCGYYTRMPQDIAEQISKGVAYLNPFTTGGRVRFRTNSEFIGIHAVMNKSVELMSRITLVAQSGFDLYRKKDGEDSDLFYCSLFPPMGMHTSFSAPCGTDGALADYTLNFPLYDGIKELYIALKKDAVISEPAPYSQTVPVVYYGSSITQGGCASRPGNTYPAMISRRLDTDFINLGFAGSCKGEALMAEYIAGLRMRIFVCDYDYNAPDAEHLEKTHLPFYRVIRSKQPDLPIIFLSAPNVRSFPKRQEALREVVRKTYQTALDEGDKKVYFIDGVELFGEDGWDSCTVDGIHPNDLGFYRMARRVEKEILKVIM